MLTLKEKLHDFFMNPSKKIQEERGYRAAVQDMERRLAEREQKDQKEQNNYTRKEKN